MHRRYKIAMLITSLVLVIVAVSAVGISYAIWTSTGSSNPSTTVDVNLVQDNNTWAKYFNYRVLNGKNEDGTIIPNADGTINVELTEFYHEAKENGSYGINLSDVYIPSQIWIKKDGNGTEERINSKEEKDRLEKELKDGNMAEENTEGGGAEEGNANYTICTYIVTSISNQVFKDTTLKELAVNVYIPSTVTSIDTMTFANLPNLEKVEFMHGNSKTITIADYAFVGCKKLSIQINNGVTITATSNAFIECGVEYKDGAINTKQ